MVYFGLVAKVVNIKIAFLNGEIEGEIYMECPPGMKYAGKDHCLILQKCI